MARNLLKGPRMKTLLRYLPLVLVVAGCGPQREEDPHRQQPVPLTTCDGLGRTDCQARSNCAVEELDCTAECRDDGHGGCLPCDAFRCVPNTPASCDSLDENSCRSRTDCQVIEEEVFCLALCVPNTVCCPPIVRCAPAAPPACSTLDRNSCSARADCLGVDLACAAICVDDGRGGCQPCDSFQCIDRSAAACEQLDPNTCANRPDCELVSAGAPRFADEAQLDGGAAAPPYEPSQYCVTRHVPTNPCDGLDESTCSSTPGCEVIRAVCDQYCDPSDASCSPEYCNPPAICVPTRCENLDANTCSTHSECTLVVPECPSTCTVDDQGNTNCTPVACDFDPVCMPAACSALDSNQCSARPDCRLDRPSACTQTCVDDGQGGRTCETDCNVAVCVDADPTDTCSGLDIVACSARTDCRLDVVDPVCPAVCTPDGQGGCLPCEPFRVCVPAPASPCEGLDANACTADSRCEYLVGACTLECIDDGQGGCVPCTPPPDQCVLRSTPVAGCGGGGSQPPGP